MNRAWKRFQISKGAGGAVFHLPDKSAKQEKAKKIDHTGKPMKEGPKKYGSAWEFVCGAGGDAYRQAKAMVATKGKGAPCARPRGRCLPWLASRGGGCGRRSFACWCGLPDDSRDLGLFLSSANRRGRVDRHVHVTGQICWHGACVSDASTLCRSR